MSVGSSTDSSDSASESDTLKHLVEEDDDEESEEVFIASDNEGQTDDWTVLGSHVDKTKEFNLRREWNRIPTSITRTLKTSVDSHAFFFSATERSTDALVFARTTRFPMYSTRKDRKIPAMARADVVAS